MDDFEEDYKIEIKKKKINESWMSLLLSSFIIIFFK
jgi:hypothetical protein